MNPITKTKSKLLLLFTALLVFSLPGLWGCDDDVELIEAFIPKEMIDQWYQTEQSMIDVLWVIDNSGSMMEEQNKLAANFDKFIHTLTKAKVDYHVGVITTDTNSKTQVGILQGNPRVIKKSDMGDAAAISAFAQNVKVGVKGSAQEKGMEAAKLLLEKENIKCLDNTGKNPAGCFLRPEAALFIIFVSDEDDQSFGEIEWYWRFFKQLKVLGNDNLVIISAVVAIDISKCRKAQGSTGNEEQGDRYVKLAEVSNFEAADLCDENYNATLQKLGFTASGLKRRLPLTRKPKMGEPVIVNIKYRCSLRDTMDIIEGYHNKNIRARCQIQCDPTKDPRTEYGISCLIDQKTGSIIDGWIYESKQNTIYFDGDAIPGPGSMVEVKYFTLTNY